MIEEIAWAAWMALVFGASKFFQSRARECERMKEWRQAAEACELTRLQEPKRLFRSSALDGWSGELEVHFERYFEGTRLVIDGLATHYDLSLSRGRTVIELGDEAFDESVLLQGRSSLVRAVFDAPTRRQARQLMIVADRVVVAEGRLLIDTPRLPERDKNGNYVTSAHSALESLGSTLERLLEFAQRLVRYEVVPRLAENARRDPEPGVRLQNLVTLVHEYPERPETRAVLLAARDDEDRAVRLQAALSLGDDGVDILMDAASGECGDDSDAARAIVALGIRVSRERVQAILGQALRARRVDSARACLKVLAAHGDAEGLEALVRVMRVERGALAIEAARALGATSPTAERALIGELESDLQGLRLAAAQALGRVGTVAAVIPLKEMEARHPDDKELHRATRQAIAEIQSRLAGALPGQLSLAEGAAGQLSLTEGDAGKLSLAEDRTRQRGGNRS